VPALKNPKHERFAQELAKGKSQSESYAEAGYRPDAGAASRLSRNVNVVSRVAELQERAAIRVEVTAESLAAELDEAKALAITQGQPAAMVSAIMGKAKLFGIGVEKLEHTGKNGGPIKTEEVGARDRIARRIAGIAERK